MKELTKDLLGTLFVYTFLLFLGFLLVPSCERILTYEVTGILTIGVTILIGLLMLIAMVIGIIKAPKDLRLALAIAFLLLSYHGIVGLTAMILDFVHKPAYRLFVEIEPLISKIYFGVILSPIAIYILYFFLKEAISSRRKKLRRNLQ